MTDRQPIIVPDNVILTKLERNTNKRRPSWDERSPSQKFCDTLRICLDRLHCPIIIRLLWISLTWFLCNRKHSSTTKLFRFIGNQPSFRTENRMAQHNRNQTMQNVLSHIMYFKRSSLLRSNSHACDTKPHILTKLVSSKACISSERRQINYPGRTIGSVYDCLTLKYGTQTNPSQGVIT